MLFSLIQKNSETKESPYDFFRYCETKIFQRKSWYPLPIHKIFRQRNVSEKWRVPLRNLLILWEIQFSTKSWYTILCNFFNPEIFWHKRAPLRNFPALWGKKFSTVINDNPLLSFKISDTRNFLRYRESPTFFSGTERQKSFGRRSWYPPPIDELFRWKYFSEKWRVPLRTFSVLWENQFPTKSWYTILCIFFNPEIFWKERVLLGTFSVLWDKKVSRESCDFPLLSIKCFDKRTFLKNEGFSYENFRYSEKINFRQNRDTLSYANFF